MLGISERARNCTDSATLRINAIARELRSQGKDVVDLSAGQPDFEPPLVLREAIIKSVNSKGSARYTPASGIKELKEVIIEKLRQENNLDYGLENISVNVGAKNSIYNIIQALVNPDDEVIIPVPYWVSYPQMVTLAGGKSVFVKTDQHFKLRAADLLPAITSKTKMIILNSPSNPSGAVIEKEELHQIADVAVKNKIYIISDEIYETFTYEKKHISIASLDNKIKEITFTVNGISKSLAVPGWRLGYIAGPKEELKAINKIQSQSVGNVTSIVQYAALALQDPEIKKFNEMMKKEFRKRRDFALTLLKKIGMKCQVPEGAFYLFPKVEVDDQKFCLDLWNKAYVAVVSGSEFGLPGYIRISYAADPETIKKGIERIGEVWKDYGKK